MKVEVKTIVYIVFKLVYTDLIAEYRKQGLHSVCVCLYFIWLIHNILPHSAAILKHDSVKAFGVILLAFFYGAE